MDLLTNCDPSHISKTFSGLWMFLLYVLNTIYTGSSIQITSSTCGEKYDMNVYKSVDLTYSGTVLLNDNPCSLELYKSSYKQYLCISGSDIQLSCRTYLEYHESFVKNYISPEEKMTCHYTRKEEWCSSQYLNRVFIVIRKPSSQTSDVIKLKVYLKDAPEDESSEGNSRGGIGLSTTIMIVVIPVATVFLITCIGVIIIQVRSKKTTTSQPQITYQVTTGSVNMQPGQGHTIPNSASPLNQPNAQAYSPVQQEGLQGHYNVYPMQTAYPVQEGAAPLMQTMYPRQGSSGQNNSSEPTADIEAPPPSYESLISGKH